MATFLAFHRTPVLNWKEVEHIWMNMARQFDAMWIRTWFNKKEGIRVCEWMAPNAEVLKEIFSRHEVAWDSILEVEKTSPGAWRWRVSPLSADEPLNPETD